jgi:hypothetical protein
MFDGRLPVRKPSARQRNQVMVLDKESWHKGLENLDLLADVLNKRLSGIQYIIRLVNKDSPTNSFAILEPKKSMITYPTIWVWRKTTVNVGATPTHFTAHRGSHRGWATASISGNLNEVVETFMTYVKEAEALK